MFYFFIYPTFVCVSESILPRENSFRQAIRENKIPFFLKEDFILKI